MSANTKKITVDQLNSIITAVATKSDLRFVKKTEVGSIAALNEIAESNLASDLADKINGKADASDIGAVGALDEVAETNLASALASKINGKADATSVYTTAQTDTAITTAITNALASNGDIANAIDTKIAATDHLSRKVVTSVADITAFVTANPTLAEKFIYLVPNTDQDNPANYDEYMYTDGALNKVGDWAVDLSGYATTADVETASSQDIQDIIDGIWGTPASGE